MRLNSRQNVVVDVRGGHSLELELGAWSYTMGKLTKVAGIGRNFLRGRKSICPACARCKCVGERVFSSSRMQRRHKRDKKFKSYQH